MLILFDNNVPRGLARTLNAHTVVEARERGWHLFENGDLLRAAEDAAFDVLVTSDKGIRYQQNSTGRKLALVVLTQGRWRLVPPEARGHCRRRGRSHAPQLHRGRNTNQLKLPRCVYPARAPFRP